MTVPTLVHCIVIVATVMLFQVVASLSCKSAYAAQSLGRRRTFPRTVFTLIPSHISTKARTNVGFVRHAVSQEHAKEVFSLIDSDNSGRIDKDELSQVLRMLDIDASTGDVSALVKHLDVNGDSENEFDEFLSWYTSAATSAAEETNVIMQALLNRRNVHKFDHAEIPDEVLRRAVEAAISAPFNGPTEPWRFSKVGGDTKRKVVMLQGADADWVKIPGWCIVTSRMSDGGRREQEDYAATSCAAQNFMLAMYAEGIGTCWKAGDFVHSSDFAKECHIELKKEKVVGLIFYGFASGGIANFNRPERSFSLEKVLTELP